MMMGLWAINIRSIAEPGRRIWEKQYHDAGQFYVYNAEKYLALHGQVNEGVMPIIVSELEVQDIDNEDDWKIAELKYQLMASR